MLPALKLALRTFDQRRHQRLRLVIKGRYMLSNNLEYPCETIDISPNGVAIKAGVSGQDGENVVAYLDEIGRLEGKIVHVKDYGFDLELQTTLARREKLANQLTWLANREMFSLTDDRRHERIELMHPHTALKIFGEPDRIIRVTDISMSGAAMMTDLDLPINTPIVVGKRPARVVRRIPGGLAIEFAVPIMPHDFNESMRL